MEAALNLFESCYSSGNLSFSFAALQAMYPISKPLKILEVVGREENTIVYYNLEKGEYIWDSISEKSILDVLSKQLYRDWWCGYPVFIHSDYRAVLARRLNLIINRKWEERAEDVNFQFFLRSGLEAWKEQLGCVWDEDKKQFIV